MKKILITSGKGGTGKSTISVSIAKILKMRGYKVGILDTDIDCPNLPEMLNIEDRSLQLSDNGIIPKVVDGMEVMSIGFIADTKYAVMWSADRRIMTIDQMINKVEWTCDVLVIDSPPGTNEELTTILKKFNPDGIVVVSTNHKASLSDVKRTLSMIDLLESRKKLLGIVKNMTYIVCSCGKETVLFSEGNDDEINGLCIDEIPYITDGINIEDFLENTISKIEEVI